MRELEAGTLCPTRNRAGDGRPGIAINSCSTSSDGWAFPGPPARDGCHVSRDGAIRLAGWVTVTPWLGTLRRGLARRGAERGAVHLPSPTWCSVRVSCSPSYSCRTGNHRLYYTCGRPRRPSSVRRPIASAWRGFPGQRWNTENCASSTGYHRPLASAILASATAGPGPGPGRDRRDWHTAAARSDSRSAPPHRAARRAAADLRTNVVV